MKSQRKRNISDMSSCLNDVLMPTDLVGGWEQQGLSIKGSLRMWIFKIHLIAIMITTREYLVMQKMVTKISRLICWGLRWSKRLEIFVPNLHSYLKNKGPIESILDNAVAKSKREGVDKKHWPILKNLKNKKLLLYLITQKMKLIR